MSIKKMVFDWTRAIHSTWTIESQ